MTSRERVLAATKRCVPDRVPHFEWEINSPVLNALSASGKLEEVTEALDLDAIMTGANYQRKPIGENLALDEWGITQVKGLMDHTIPLDERAPIKNETDLKAWNPPDPFAPNRLEKFAHYQKLFGGKRAVIIYVRDVFSLPRDLMGYLDLMVACKTKPEVVLGIIQKGVDHNLKIIEQAVKLGAELVFTGDDIADNRSTLISPKMWQELFAPSFNLLSQAFHSYGLLQWKHSDGNIMPVMDSLIAAGIDGIDPIDPLGGMCLATVKEKYGKRVAIKGNIDCANLLVNGTEGEVVEAVKDCIRTAGPGGGYVCSSSNSIHNGVSPKLYQAMVNAIHEYGAYPLDMDRLAPKRSYSQ
jgi:uroporphyrinogen decarboxylase